MKFPFQMGPILTRMPVDYTFVQWDRKGAGHGGIGGSCYTGRASSGLSQTRMSFVHGAAMISYVLFGSWGTRRNKAFLCPPPTAFLLIFYLFFFSIWGERNMWQETILEQVPRRGLSDKKDAVGSGSFVIEHREKDDLCLVPPAERAVSIPTRPLV